MIVGNKYDESQQLIVLACLLSLTYAGEEASREERHSPTDRTGYRKWSGRGQGRCDQVEWSGVRLTYCTLTNCIILTYLRMFCRE